MPRRATKPTALRAIEGGRSHSLTKPEDVNEPKPPPVAPDCPVDLDAAAAETWRKLAPKLERLGLLTELDGGAFSDVCQLRSRIIAIREAIKIHKCSLLEIVDRPDPDGGTHQEYKPHPLIMMERQAYQLFRQLAGEFGLTPRGRVGLTVGRDKDGAGDDLI